MSHLYPLTSALSPRIEVRASTGSTNDDLVSAVAAEPGAWPHLSVLLTGDQRAGRGRRDRVWVAPAGAALAVSVLVRVPGIPVAARGWIPLAAGAAMTRAVAAQAAPAGHSVALKWPNDVLVDGRKICGILAAGVPGAADAVVVGAGVNTRMTPAELPVPTATSFAAVGLEAAEDRLVADFVGALAEQLAAIADARGDASAAGVRGEVEALCATLGADVRVSLPDGSELVGRAVRIDATGRLVVDAAGGESAVSAGDVTHVRPV